MIATRQYAKRQIKWIRHKLLPALSAIGAKSQLFVLDTTCLSTFESEAEAKALDISLRFLKGETLPEPVSTSDVAMGVLSAGEGPGGGKEIKEMQSCGLCSVAVMTGKDWANHLRSTKHRRAEKRRKQDARNPHKREAKQGIDSRTVPKLQACWTSDQTADRANREGSDGVGEFIGLGTLVTEEEVEEEEFKGNDV